MALAMVSEELCQRNCVRGNDVKNIMSEASMSEASMSKA